MAKPERPWKAGLVTDSGNQVGLTQKRLLFVDDEPGVRATLSAILRRYGFTVTVAASVEEALEQIRTHEFDLLLCDLNLQGEGDGYAVIRAMRESNPRCVTMVLTGYPGVNSAVEGIHVGIDDYIVKPARPEVLVALLAEKLATRQPRARILSISYDETLLRMRHLIFQNAGYEVVSAGGFSSGLTHAKEGVFDALVLGHSVPYEDKQKMLQAFREFSTGTVVSLRSGAGDQLLEGADHHIESDPESLLKLVAEIVGRKLAAKHARPV
jgi:DNA-binding response OmpR family regulator